MSNNLFRRIFLLAALVMLFCNCAAPAYSAQGKIYNLDVGESAIIGVMSVTRISVGNPDVLDAQPLSPREVLITGKAEGGATLIVWDASGRQFFNVQVHNSKEYLVDVARKAIGYEGVTVRINGEQIVIEGVVQSNVERKRAELIAAGFAAKVVNLLEVREPKMVRIDGNIVELDRTQLDKIGMASIGGEYDKIAGDITFFADVYRINFDYNKTASYVSNLVGAFDALAQGGKAKILSQPHLTTIAGNKATILVGGEIPIPVGLDNGKISIEWKEYGVRLTVLPEITAEDRFNVTIEAEVSAIDEKNGIKVGDLEIPALTTRKASTQVEVRNGQPILIAGLIKNDESKIVRKFPILGDLPIIGELFKSTEFKSEKTELVISVTPTLVSVR